MMSRAEVCAGCPGGGLVRPFGDIDLAMTGVLLN